MFLKTIIFSSKSISFVNIKKENKKRNILTIFNKQTKKKAKIL